MEINLDIKKLEDLVKDYDKYNDFKEAYDLHKKLNEIIVKTDLRNSNPKEYRQIYILVIKLKFLSLNFFDDWEEIGSFLKDHLDKALELEYFDLWQKIETNLLVEENMDERDLIKRELLKKLSESNCTIVDRDSYRSKQAPLLTVADWIRDFNYIFGSQAISTLEKTKYLANGKSIIDLKENDKKKIKKLLELYEKLKLSSNTPQGYEESIPIDINGELYIFRRGEMQPLKNILKSPKDVIGPPKTTEEKRIEDLVVKKKEVGEENLAGRVVGEEIDNTKKIEDLKIMLNKYKNNSLQKRAIEEEIKKLEN